MYNDWEQGKIASSATIFNIILMFTASTVKTERHLIGKEEINLYSSHIYDFSCSSTIEKILCPLSCVGTSIKNN